MWFWQRLLTHDTLTVGRIELMECWSMDDAVEQHRVLDLIDEQRRRDAERRK